MKTMKEINCEFRGCFKGCCFELNKCPVMAYDVRIKKEALKWRNQDITLKEFIDKFFGKDEKR